MAHAATQPVRRVVVGFDGSAAATAALDWAADQAASTGPSSRWWPRGRGRPATAPRWSSRPTTTRPVTPRAWWPGPSRRPGAVIPTSSSCPPWSRDTPPRCWSRPRPGADLLALGTRGHGEVSGILLGSVSEHCAAHAHCPVLVIRERPPSPGGGRRRPGRPHPGADQAVPGDRRARRPRPRGRRRARSMGFLGPERGRARRRRSGSCSASSDRPRGRPSSSASTASATSWPSTAGWPRWAARRRCGPASPGPRPSTCSGQVHGRVDAAYRDELVERFDLDPSQEGPGLLQGQPPEGGADRRPHVPPRPAGPRRADVRARPAEGARVPALRGRGPRPRPDRVPLVARPRRGRGPVRPGRDPPARAGSSRSGTLAEHAPPGVHAPSR